MCGIAAIIGNDLDSANLEEMVAVQRHRGPDAEGRYSDPHRAALLGHNRLSILDLSDAGRQPLSGNSGRYWIVFNGEIYNYLELRDQLRSNYRFHTGTDTEVLLAAYQEWGELCLDRLIGMFSFAIWDELTSCLFAARDRFGVKPLYYHHASDGTLLIASEIRTLHAAGVPANSDHVAWATYLAHGLYDYSERTFWDGINSLPPGHSMKLCDGRLRVSRWYDLAERVDPEWDNRAAEVVKEEYLSLLVDSVRLRFRSDVPAGINLSGGLDSSILLGLVQAVQGDDSDVKAFTFITGDSNYDELPWVSQMLASTRHPSVVCRLSPSDVPALAESVQAHESEPFGGLPTLAYARLFEMARAEGVIVLLDGQGMDEQWAGYDYYVSALNGEKAGIVQGVKGQPVKPECLTPEFRQTAEQFEADQPFTDPLMNLQYRDACYTKIPRALRFNDRVSMRSSTELREPFLDHRLFELALRQRPERKIASGTGKWFLRELVKDLLPNKIIEAPKRALQTPQREWLRGPLHEWAHQHIESALANFGGSWLSRREVGREWRSFQRGETGNSFYVWQWISVGLMANSCSDSRVAYSQ